MLKYIKGYCTITIEGVYLEKFITDLAKNRVTLFNIIRINQSKIEASIYKEDLNILIKLYEKSQYKLKIKKSMGLPFLMKRIYKRKSLLIGGVISLLILFYLTTLITNVYIKSPEGIDKDKLRKALYSSGLKPLSSKYMINKKEISDLMIVKFDNIAYVSINVKGTNVYVDVIKKADEPKNSTLTNCNIIAQKNGIIEKIIPRSGDTLVNKGDIVKKGDILIAGGNTIAKGEVWAKTFYEITESIKYDDKLKIKTGKCTRFYKVNLLNKDHYFKKKIPYKNYVIEKKHYKLEYKEYKAPIDIEVISFYEVNIKENKENISKIQENLKDVALKKLDYMLPIQARIINTKENYNVLDGKLIFSITVECLENIGKDELIKGGSTFDDTKENIN